MAFIRWKKNQYGMAYAHLVHSYRDANGKPRHKTLAYLGKKGELTDDHLAKLKERHKNLTVNWYAIKLKVSPKLTEISQLSNAELLSQLKTLRLERGLTVHQIVQTLLGAGVPTRSKHLTGFPITLRWYRRIEKACLEGITQDFYNNLELELAPYLRKVL